MYSEERENNLGLFAVRLASFFESVYSKSFNVKSALKEFRKPSF